MQKTNNTRKLSQVYLDLYGELCVFALRYVHSPTEAEDVVEDVFCHLIVTKPRFLQEKDFGAIRAYLFKSTRNKAIDLLRKKKKDVLSIDEEINDAELNALVDSLIIYRTEESYDYDLLVNSIQSAIDSLSDKTRQIFQMSRDSSLPNKEIAKQLNLSVKTIEKHMSKALAVIRKTLEKINIPFIIFILFFLFEK